jgi:hypothetical protein
VFLIFSAPREFLIKNKVLAVAALCNRMLIPFCKEQNSGCWLDGHACSNFKGTVSPD